MNKTLRNRALRNSYRLITGDMNGENWSTPDGHFAVAHPIYDGYRMKKSQTVPDVKPDMTKALAMHKQSDYTTVDTVEFLPTGIDGVSNSYDVYRFTSGDNYWDVNADYYNLIKDIYPEHDARVEVSGWNYAPIEIYQDNVLVAVLMPLKR